MNQQTIENEIIAKTEDSSLKLAYIAVQAAIDKKAENVKLLDLQGISSIADYFMICSGLSNKQVQSVADAIQVEAKKAGFNVRAAEGYTDGRWVLVDLGDIVVHVFLDALRDYYNLDGLWTEAKTVEIPSEFYGSNVTRLN